MDIVGMVAMAHSPSWDLGPVSGPGARYVEAVMRARDKVQAVKPDVFVLFGPDHVRNFFFDMMPAFCIGAEGVTGFGDYSSPGGPMPCASGLAHHIADSVMADGFDPAISLKMGIDHGITQPYAALEPDLRVPMVPIMVSSAGPPLPSLRRCHEFGAAVGRAVRGYSGGGRAVIVGSGGLSHSPPSISPADAAVGAEMRDYVIAGRDRVREFNASRERMSLTRRQAGNTGPVNEDWDKWFLSCIKSGDMDPLLAVGNDELLEKAGVGGQEIRSWMAALGAWNRPVTDIAYEPVPVWITGMGCISGFTS